MAWEDLTPDLTEAGKEKLKVGDVLGFDYEGTRIDIKIMRKSHGKVWCKQVKTYAPEEVIQKLLDAPEPLDDEDEKTPNWNDEQPAHDIPEED